ncbi:MAG: OmpP1/FadL family transporter [Panacagrimonas sp.]
MLTLVLAVWEARAGNGLNDSGYGSESAGLAGTDLAVARDTAATNTNPAGLTQIRNRKLDLLAEPFAYAGQRHRDQIGNDTGPDNLLGLILGGGYAQRIKDTNVVVGAGLFAQGGIGFVYENFDTQLGERDTLSGLSGSFKLAPGFAWAVNERWSIGATLGILYSSSRQKILPNTSTPDFSGYRVDGLRGVSVNAKVGVQYRPSPDWVLAAAYTSRAPIRLRSGTVRVNNSGSGGGTVDYRSARQTGLSFAQEVGVGALYRVNPRWSLVGEFNWLDWSAAVSSVRLSASNPDDPDADPEFVRETPLDWRDQYLISVGSLYQWTPATELRAGFSHARNPIPKSSLSPTFAAIAESSITAGIAQDLNPNWTVAATALYQPPVTVKYDSPLTGPSSERWGVTGFYITLSRNW